MTAQTLINDTRRDDLLASAAACGTADGQGVNARPELAMKVVEMAKELDLGSDDAADIWTKFQEARAAAKGLTRAGKEQSFKVQVSKLNTFIKAAALPNVDFAEVLGRARAFIDQTDDLKGSTFDNMLTVAREQQSKDYRDNPLTDDQIEKILRGDAPKEKTELDYLKPIEAQLDKLFNGTENSENTLGRPAFPSTEVETALKAVRARIGVLEIAQKEQDLAKQKAEYLASITQLPAAEVTEQGNAPATSDTEHTERDAA